MNNTISKEFFLAIRFYTFLTQGALIIAVNLVIIVMSFLVQALKGQNFRFFLLNLAGIELSQGIVLILIQAPNLPDHGILCKAGGAAFAYLSGAITFGAAPIILSRYWMICRPHIFEPCTALVQILPLCALPYVATLPNVLIPGLRFGRMHDFAVCGTDSNLSLSIFGGLSISFLLATCTYCTYSVVQELKVLKFTQELLGPLQKDKLNTSRFLLRTAWLQTLSPIFLSIPVLIFYIAGGADLESSWNLIVPFIFNCNALFDPVCTLIVVKPYRRAIVSAIRKLHNYLSHTSEVLSLD